MNKTDETIEDYLAQLNLEGRRGVWLKNRRKIKFVFRKAHRYLSDKNIACDIGVGEGHLLRILAKNGFQVTGVDISKYLVKQLGESFEKENLKISLVCGDIAVTDLGKNTFDVITCIDILEHIPGDGLSKAVANIKRCLRHDGLLIATLPLKENLEKKMVICPQCGHKFHAIGHHHSFKDMEMIRTLLGPEFTIVKYGSVPLGLFEWTALNRIAYWLYRLACAIAGKEEPKTLYFIARLKKGK